MKNISLMLLLISIVTGCTAPSKPMNKEDSLNGDYGVIIFSTIDDGSTTFYRSDTFRKLNAVLTLGVSEVDTDSDVHLNFSKCADSEQNLISDNNKCGFSFYVFHPYLTKERALDKKWHILKLKAGNYKLAELTLRNGNENKANPLKGGYSFTVKSGESLYLGDIRLSIKLATGTPYSSYFAFVTDIGLSANEASEVLSGYKNYPQNMKLGKFE